jgi:molecular chaperone HtpG
MSAEHAQKQEFAFQAEIKQVLHLLSHSLYQSREIALRELVSNASDALDKMRFVSLTDDARRDCGPLEITIEPDEAARTLTIRDTGVGMTHEELIANLGTIARSGSGEFLKGLTAEDREKAQLSLIGQFGVGFYAAFMIADQVRVRTRSHRDETGQFTVEPVADALPRGTEIILHLKEDAQDFASPHRIKEIVRRYSSFIPHPIKLAPGGEVLNDQKPIWVEPKRQVTDEQHERFYQHLSHHPQEKPLWRLHVSVDSPIQFHAVLYCPASNMERMGFPRVEHGVSLCAKRVLVQSDCRELLPEYLRFLFGLVDSEDLPLNVSRETLQDNTVIRRIRGSLVKSIFDRLEQLAKDEPEAFQTFTDQFGALLKEGAIVDFPQRDRLAKLIRFASSHDADGKLDVSLDDYIGRMPEGQTRIYFLGGPDLAAIEKNPNLEVFRKRKLEVLYLTEPVDEFVMNALGSYSDKLLTSIDSDDLDLPDAPAEEKEKEAEASKAEPGFDRVLTLFREAVGDRVREVRESRRLTDSPCCLVNADGSLSMQMQRILKMANQAVPEASRILEVNPKAPLIRRLSRLSANADHDAFIKECGIQLWSNALILEGVTPDARDLVGRIQNFMDEAAEKRSPLIVM